MADDQGRLDTRTNGEINLEAIGRFQIEIDNNPDYRGDRDDDLVFLATHIDEDPEIFLQYVESKLENYKETGREGLGTKTNGDINLEAIARFLEAIDQNQNYCGDREDDLEFLVKHIDADPEIFDQYVEKKLQNIQENDERGLGKKTNADINLEAIARFQVEADKNSYYCGDLDQDLLFLAKHIDADPEILRQYVTMLLNSHEDSDIILNPDEFFRRSSAIRGILENGSENENIVSTTSSLSSADPGLVADNLRSRRGGNPRKRKSFSAMAERFRRMEQFSVYPEEAGASSEETIAATPDGGGTIRCGVHGQVNEEVEHSGKSLAEKWTILLDECSGDDSDSSEEGDPSVPWRNTSFMYKLLLPPSIGLDDITQRLFKKYSEVFQHALDEFIEDNPHAPKLVRKFIMKYRPELVKHRVDKLIERNPEDREGYMIAMALLKRENESVTMRDLSFLRKRYSERMVGVADMLIQEHPEDAEAIMNMKEQLNWRHEMDTGDSSSPTEKYMAVRRIIKEIPELADLALAELIRKHPEHRDLIVNMMDLLKRENETDTERDSSSFVHKYMFVRRHIKENPELADLAVAELIRKHPEHRGLIVSMMDLLKRENETDTERDSSSFVHKYMFVRRHIKENPELADLAVAELIRKHPEHRGLIVSMMDQLKRESEADTEIDASFIFESLMDVQRSTKENPKLADRAVAELIKEHPDDRDLIENIMDKLKRGNEVDTERDLPSSVDKYTTVRRIIKENPELADLALAELVKEHPEHRDLIVNMMDLLKLENETDTERDLSSFVHKYMFVRRHIKENPELADLAVAELIKEHPEDRDLIVNMMDQLNGNEADTEIDSSSFVHKYMFVRRHIKENPELADLVVAELIRKHPEDRDLIVNMMDKLKRGDDAATERDVSSFVDICMAVERRIKENPLQADLAAAQFIEEHPEKRGFIMYLMDQLIRWNEADTERDLASILERSFALEILIKENPVLADQTVDKLIEENPEKKDAILNVIDQIKKRLGADTEMSDAYRELEGHYRTLQQQTKDDPDVMDWVVDMIFEENHEKRETLVTVFDRLKRGTITGSDSFSSSDTDSEIESSDDKDMFLREWFKREPERVKQAFDELIKEHPEKIDSILNMMDQLKRGNNANTERNPSLMGGYMNIQRLVQSYPEQADHVFKMLAKEHPEERTAIANFQDKLKRWQEDKQEKKVLVKYVDGIVSFLNELTEEHPDILRDKEADTISDKQGRMLSGALMWISEEPGLFDEYTWAKIQNNPEHGRELAKITDYLKLRAKVMTLQELVEVDPEHFDKLVAEMIQVNQIVGDVVVRDAVDSSLTSRNLKAIDKLMMHLEQKPSYFGDDLAFLLKHIDEIPELFDSYIQTMMNYSQKDKNTIFYPERILDKASRIGNILEKNSDNVTSGSTVLALIDEESAIFDEYVISRVVRNPTQNKAIATMTEKLKRLQEESIITEATCMNASTAEMNAENQDGRDMQNIRHNSNTTSDEFRYQGSSLARNWALLLEKYYPSTTDAERSDQKSLATKYPDSKVACSVRRFRESLGDLCNLIEKSRYSQAEKSASRKEYVGQSNVHEVNDLLKRMKEATETGGVTEPLLKELYLISPAVYFRIVVERLADERFRFVSQYKTNEWNTEDQIKRLLQDSDYSWICPLLQVDTGKVNETLEQMVRTVLNRNETLVMINELKAPFERERIIREYIMTGKREYFDKILSFKDQYLGLLDKLSRDIVKRNPELKPRATYRINRLLVHPLHQPEKTMMLPFGQSKVLDEDSSMANLTEPKSFELRGGTVWGETILLSLLGTDSEVLDHMMKSVLKKYDSHDNILRVIQTIKLKMLLDKDKKLLQSLRLVFGFETNDPLPLDAVMKEHLELISGNYPMKTDADRQIRVAGSANRLDKIYDFAENRNEMMKVHSQLQNVGWGKSKHEDISKEIKDGKALMSTLQKEVGDLLTIHISEDNVTLISRFIVAGIDLETRDSQGYAMLVHAVRHGKDQLAEMLIKAGCDFEARDRTGGSVVSKAAFQGFSSIVGYLINAGAAVEDEGINAAVQEGHVDVMRTFIKHGKHLIVQNGEEFLFRAITNGQYDMVKLIIDLGVEVEEDTLRGKLVATVTGGNGNGGAIAVLQTDMMSPSLNMNLEYIRQVAKHGDLDLYRQMVLLRKPRYPDIIDLPHKTDLPYFPVVDCNVHRTITDEQINSTFHLNEWFPALTEITILPGYGIVNGLLSLQELNNDPKLHTFHEISEYCDKIVKESINNAEIKEEGIRFSYRKCGSSAEGTKVAFPDEFDYFLRCHVDIDALDIKDEGYGYVVIKSADRDLNELKCLIDRGSKSFHDVILVTVISEERHKDKIMTRPGFTRGGGTASTEMKVRYKFDDDHSLDISVDLVPVLHIDGWPNDARQATWLMNKRELQEEGYAFVAKPPSRKSKFGKQFRDEVQSKMWRISFGHLEARHLAELDQRTRDVYITCKAIRNPDISHMMFEDSNEKPLSMSKDLITSYWLKMVFMFNVPEFLLKKRTLVEMVYIVYSQLAKCISLWWLPFYWQPGQPSNHINNSMGPSQDPKQGNPPDDGRINVLEGLSQDPKQCKQAAKLMKRLATGWFMRDGHTDCVEEEETKKGGIYPYLPPKPSRVRRAGGNKGGEGSADVRKTKKDDEAKAGCPECSDGDGDEVVSPDVGGRVGKPVVGEKVCDAENGGRVGGPEDGERVRGPEVGDRVGGPRRDDKVSGPDAGGALNGHEDNSEGGCSEDEDDDDSEDEFEVITYSRTPKTIRDPGYKLYRL